MNEIYPLGLLFVTGIVWFLLGWQHLRLICTFRDRYPQIAQREIPYLFDSWAHPEKVIFFLRRRAVEILRTDSDLWRKRQRFIMLFWLSILVPLGGFLPGFIYAIIMSQR